MTGHPPAGYDGSLINNLLQNPWFQEAFGTETTGIWAGIVSSMYQIGGVVALPFVGPAIDTWGRRIGMLIGATIIIVGTIIQGTSHEASQFMGGRFLLGFGVSIAAAAGPMYVVEINHPAYRGVVGALYNTLWFRYVVSSQGRERSSLSRSPCLPDPSATAGLSWPLAPPVVPSTRVGTTRGA